MREQEKGPFFFSKKVQMKGETQKRSSCPEKTLWSEKVKLDVYISKMVHGKNLYPKKGPDISSRNKKGPKRIRNQEKGPFFSRKKGPNET